MNTPAHSIINLLVLDRGRFEGQSLPLLIGSLAPDAPMLLFYLYEKLILGTPEMVIWGERYFQPGWQNFFDLFNSIPVALVIVAIAWRREAWGWCAFGASAILHCLGDLPLHSDDGHRHLFPISPWRFESPVSYWDPSHFGQYVALLEIAAVVAGCVVLLRRYPSKWARGMVAGVAALYAVYLLFVILVWL